jgi:hypothetical protein
MHRRRDRDCIQPRPPFKLAAACCGPSLGLLASQALRAEVIMMGRALGGPIQVKPHWHSVAARVTGVLVGMALALRLAVLGRRLRLEVTAHATVPQSAFLPKILVDLKHDSDFTLAAGMSESNSATRSWSHE